MDSKEALALWIKCEAEPSNAFSPDGPEEFAKSRIFFQNGRKESAMKKKILGYQKIIIVWYLATQ